MVAGTGGDQIALIIYGLILRFHPLTNLSQIVKEPTCFMKNSTPSLVDAILTNKNTMCFNTHTIPTGVSDCYNLISTTIKGNLPVQVKEKYHTGVPEILILISLTVTYKNCNI